MQKYKSKVDWWIGLTLLWPFVWIVMLVVDHGSQDLPQHLVGMSFFVWLFWTCFQIEYEVHTDKLVVITYFRRWHYPYEDIRFIRPTKNLFCETGMSLNKLHVELHDRSTAREPKWGIMISPFDKEDFLDAILAQTDRLRREGDRLVCVTEG